MRVMLLIKLGPASLPHLLHAHIQYEVFHLG